MWGKPKTPPTLSMLYLPGGGVLPLIYLTILARMEELSGLQTRKLFPAVAAASGGSIIAGLLYGPDPLTAKDALEKYRSTVQKFIPPQKGRLAKMMVANGFSTLRNSIDGHLSDSLRLQDIAKIAEEMRRQSDPGLHERIASLETLATKPWPKTSDVIKAYEHCEKLRKKDSGLIEGTDIILAHVRARVKERTRPLSIFNQAVTIGENFVTRRWAKNYLYDESVQQETFDAQWGAHRLADFHGTVYIYAHDTIKNEATHFFTIKKNLLNPDTKRILKTSEGNHRITDAIKSSASHQLIVVPHQTEDGKFCNDAGAWYPFDRDVMRVRQALQQENSKACMNVFILNTGSDVGKSANLEEEQRRQRESGLPGALADGSQLARISGNINSGAKQYLKEIFEQDGVADGILEIMPRAIARNAEEFYRFPSLNPLDSSDKNLDDVMVRGRDVVIEEDIAIRSMAQRAVDNLKSSGYLNAREYAEKKWRIENTPVAQNHQPIISPQRDHFAEIRAEIDQQTLVRISRYFSKLSGRFASSDEEILSEPPANDMTSKQLPPPSIEQAEQAPELQKQRFG